MTAKWLGMTEHTVEVLVYQDFDLGFGDDAAVKDILTMATGATPLISREAALQEFKRRGVLGPQYDPEADLAMIEQGIEDDPLDIGDN